MRGIFVYSVPALQRHTTENSKQVFLQKELRGLSPKFQIHVFVSNLYFPWSVCLFCCRKIYGPIQGKYKSLADTWMWKLGLRPRNSFSGNTLLGFSLQCGLTTLRCYVHGIILCIADQPQQIPDHFSLPPTYTNDATWQTKIFVEAQQLARNTFQL